MEEKRQLRGKTRDLLLGGIVKGLLCLEEEKDATLKKRRKKKHFAWSWRNKKILLGTGRRDLFSRNMKRMLGSRRKKKSTADWREDKK